MPKRLILECALSDIVIADYRPTPNSEGTDAQDLRVTNAVGAVVHFDLAVSYDPGDSDFSYDVTGLPPGVTTSAISPLISGYPTTPGTYHVSVTVNDPYDDSATTSFTWTVTRRAYYWSQRRPPLSR